MIHLNQAVGLGLSTKNRSTTCNPCILYKESAKQPASPLSPRHVHIANDNAKQLQVSKQMHVCFSPELFS